MGNIYGISQANPLPAVYTAGADVACAAGVETNVLTTGAINAGTDPGDFFPLVLGVVSILLGATAPTVLVVAFRLGAGADVDSFSVAPALLTANATLQVPIALVGANSPTAWGGAGSTLNLTVNATGQAVTAKAVGSRMVVALLRGPNA